MVNRVFSFFLLFKGGYMIKFCKFGYFRIKFIIKFLY